ncbi:DUF2690 domain-containing protein [Streptomyces sp. NPDC046985]|uniref:XRE family transcriptional regulator n=1 Tax=Streptomyces sp. NPDC046985 TaxID=3155377 RepID=UPI0033D8F165
MPRWKALPDELDPQIREFVERLRSLVERGGLSAAALADRTGYSRASWDRYLDGRLLAPRGAAVALAEVTGAPPGHLTVLWELAERAWRRAEPRYDRRSEDALAAGSRTALGESGASARPDHARTTAPADPAAPPPEGATRPLRPAPAPPPQGTVRSLRPAPAPPPQGATQAPRPAAVQPSRPAPAKPPRSATAQQPGSVTVPPPESAAQPPETAASAPAPVPRPVTGAGAARRRAVMFFAGLVAALLLIGAVFLLTGGDTGGGGGTARGPAASPSPTAATGASLPPGVECVGGGCTGKDAEATGCSGELASTARSVIVGGTLVEVRYSKTCGAAWGRITRAAPGDRVRLTAGARVETDTVGRAGDNLAYTPMVAVPDARRARACVTLASGRTGCTP